MCFVVFVSKLYRYNNVILLTKNISTIEIYDIWKLQLLPNKTRRTRERERDRNTQNYELKYTYYKR